MEYPICQNCGAAVGDMKLHERWHVDQERTIIDKAVEKTMRELDRKVRMARLGRPR